MVVPNQGTQLVKLKDIAHVELGPEDDRFDLPVQRISVGGHRGRTAVEGEPPRCRA